MKRDVGRLQLTSEEADAAALDRQEWHQSTKNLVLEVGFSVIFID